MGAMTTYMPTLADLATRLDPNGNVAAIIELLNMTNPVLEDMPFIEGNLPTGHKTTVRSGLPEGTWRKLNYGVPPEKSTTVQVVDTCGMLESYAEVDKALVDLNGNAAAFRLSEDRAFIEGMNQTMASTLFYGNTAVDPEKFMGFTPRFDDLSAENAGNVVNAGSGQGNSGQANTSIWLVVWGPNTAHGIYPKGSRAGLSSQDLGEVTLEDGNGGKYQGYRTHYKWDIGLTVRDWRYVVRIANINTATLAKDGSSPSGSGDDLVDLMTDAIERIPNLGMGRPVFYANRKITSYLRRQIMNKVVNSTLTMDQVAGRRVLAFDGIPVRRTDALINTEAKLA